MRRKGINRGSNNERKKNNRKERERKKEDWQFFFYFNAYDIFSGTVEELERAITTQDSNTRYIDR